MDPLTDEFTECTTKTEVEAANLEYLPELFICANDTPLHLSPLLDDFGYNGDTKASDEVTAGTYIPPQGTDEYTKLFLKCARQLAHVATLTVSDRFTRKPYIKRWQSKREKTSSIQSEWLTFWSL